MLTPSWRRGRCRPATLSAFADDAVRVACGVLMPQRPTQGLGARWLWRINKANTYCSFLMRLAWSRHHSLMLVSGACAVFYTDDLRNIGGFRPDSWVEDYDVMYRLHAYHRDQQQRPCRVDIVPQAWASTDAPTTAGTFLRQRRRWFGGFVETLWTYRHFVGTPRWGYLGLLHLPIKVLDALQPWFITALLISTIIFFINGGQIYWLILAAVVGKWLLDATLNTYVIRWFRQWTAAPSLPYASAWWLHLTEPFAFQWLRLTGAWWGWWSCWRRQHNWVH